MSEERFQYGYLPSMDRDSALRAMESDQSELAISGVFGLANCSDLHADIEMFARIATGPRVDLAVAAVQGIEILYRRLHDMSAVYALEILWSVIASAEERVKWAADHSLFEILSIASHKKPYSRKEILAHSYIEPVELALHLWSIARNDPEVSFAVGIIPFALRDKCPTVRGVAAAACAEVSERDSQTYFQVLQCFLSSVKDDNSNWVRKCAERAIEVCLFFKTHDEAVVPRSEPGIM